MIFPPTHPKQSNNSFNYNRRKEEIINIKNPDVNTDIVKVNNIIRNNKIKLMIYNISGFIINLGFSTNNIGYLGGAK